MFVVAAVLAAPRHSDAQTVSVSGVVVDARTGQPLPGVLVRVEEGPRAAATDSEGRFNLDLPAGRYTLAISMIGFAFVRQPLDVTGEVIAKEPLRIELAEGAGAYEEHVSVQGTAQTGAGDAPAGATLHGRDLQALRGVTLDDPLRALHALPSASANDDFYSEFAVRGLGFGHTGLAVDGLPSRYLMHSVHGVSDGGSITMLNTDAVASVALLPGSYPQKFGRRIGAQVNVETREGDRNNLRVRAGLSGTSATLLSEGPLPNSRGSWLVSVRRSYLDLL
ncbi:MAG TPA: carboxypeptidase-like regulatory domain-containing protein, partial [Vicinamibacterales bacterium]|nr:carboxypeptidase-like regulatory domain-containing protein [Vicinamibacterales bacterium]